MSDQQLAESACKSVYGSCSTGTCGQFSYYYSSSAKSCNCAKAIGQYEFIYANTGASTVGQDYSGASSTNVLGNTLFVRKKDSSLCNSNSWTLVQSDLGQGIYPKRKKFKIYWWIRNIYHKRSFITLRLILIFRFMSQGKIYLMNIKLFGNVFSLDRWNLAIKILHTQ